MSADEYGPSTVCNVYFDTPSFLLARRSMTAHDGGRPPIKVGNQGLYREDFEHDACGIGAIANLKGDKSHQLLDDALSVLVNLEHRGGKGLEENTGDGAGILFQVPHRFFRKEAQKCGHLLPDEGDYGVAMVSLEPPTARDLDTIRSLIEEHVRRTKSPRGIKMLYQFDGIRGRFVKVIAHEYEVALELAEKAEMAGATHVRVTLNAPHVDLDAFRVL